MDNPETTATTPTKPVLATLGDLECATITVEIELADEARVQLPIKMIPQYRMMQLSAMVPSATPPVKDFDLTNHGKPVYNYSDPAYVANVGEVNFKRSSLMLAEMVLLEIPGDTLEAKAEYIREKFDPIVTDQLIAVVGERREKAKARVITRAETFLG